VDNIRIDFGKIVWIVVDWIGLVQDRDQWITLEPMHNRRPQGNGSNP
jgi:hypothetical protein